MLEFLKDNSNMSSTRLVLILGMIGVLCLSSGVLFYIIWNTIKGVAVEWSGITLFLGGLSAIIGTLLYGKVKQKSIEVASNIATKNDI